MDEKELPITLRELRRKYAAGEPIVSLTAYDYPLARLEDAAGVDIIHVGDTLGTNVLGYESEREVTLAEMVHHLKAVRRGVRRAYLMVDMPFATYDEPAQALKNAHELIAAGADIVKLEECKKDCIRRLVEQGIAVCGHLGLTPQTHVGEYTVQGKTFAAARVLVEDARAIEAAGAALLVLELVPEEVAAVITEVIEIPTIGIGSGGQCSGQIQVVPDILGLTSRVFRHAMRVDSLGERSLAAMNAYTDAVRDRRFPTRDNSFHAAPADIDKLRRWVAEEARGLSPS